jgi:hypothetical protein
MVRPSWTLDQDKGVQKILYRMAQLKFEVRIGQTLLLVGTYFHNFWIVQLNLILNCALPTTIIVCALLIPYTEHILIYHHD